MAAARGDFSLALLQMAAAKVSGQASGSRIGDALSHSSQRRRPARKLSPIKIFGRRTGRENMVGIQTGRWSHALRISIISACP
jgi:hypothetical protein